MKQFKLLRLMAVMLLLSLNATAQDANKFYPGNVSCMKGLTIDLPLYLENTNPNIVALQFDIVTPQGATLSTSSSENKVDATRAVDHRINIRKLSSSGDNRYRLILLSPTNKPFRANKGVLGTVKMTIADAAALEEEQTYPLTVSSVILSDSLGNNVMTAYESGSLSIGANPDFVVENVRLTGNTTVNPKDSIAIAWSVRNSGSAAAKGGFRESISLVSNATGEQINLGTVYHNNVILASGATHEVTSKFFVPRIVGLDGLFRIKVTLTPNSDSGERKEYQSNNTTLSSESENYTMNKVLYLTQRDAITETDASSRYAYYVERSGSRAEEMTFPVTLTGGDSRLSLSANEIIIKKNSYSEYVYLYVAGNNTLEGDVDFTVGIPASYSYQAMESPGKLIDNELPDFTIVPSQESVTEGDIFTFTITASRHAEEDVTIRLSNNATTRFSIPSSIVLPKGERSVEVMVQAYEDNDVQEEYTYVLFRASADNYGSGDCIIELVDNDMPQLTLDMTPDIISESAGPRAISACLRRDVEHSGSKLTVKVTTTNESRLYSNTQTITMNPGVQEANFSFAAVDNALKDGDEDITVTATVYISSCRCSANGSLGGMVIKNVTILDNDGPAITLEAAKSNMLEGSTNNKFTVKRNDSPTNSLTVALSSTGSDLVFPSTVTIPAGQTSADFYVELQRNSIQGDSRTITFTAETNGYAKGTCWVMSTDQTLPDVYAYGVTVNGNVYATLESDVSLTVRNIGYDVLPAKTPVVLTCGANRVKTVLYTENDIAAGDEATVSGKIILSDAAGTFKLSATVNDDRGVKELNYSDNTSEQIDLVINPLISATSVSTNKAVYATGEKVIITGKTTGMVFREADIEVYLVNGGNRYTVNGKTDSNGEFEVEWAPAGNVAGVFSVGACMPKENLKKEYTSIGIYGLRRASTKYLTHEFKVSEVKEGFIDVYNHGNAKLTDITVEAIDMPDNITCEFEGLASLAAGATDRIVYRMTGLEASKSYDAWQIFKARITSAEGAVLDVPLHYAVYKSIPQLKASTNIINTTMIMDTVRYHEFTIRNEGLLETGAINVDLGDIYWLSTATPKKMASLKTGEEATVVLQFKPDGRTPLNSIYTGNIYLSCENGGGVSVNLKVECVSDRTGTLVIDVWDEFTANTPEAPHVEGATVNVLHPVTQKLLRQYVTGADGLATFDELPEGKYLVKVTHPKHSSWSQNIIVSPGRETRQRAFIQYSAVTIKMEYVKTEIEDEYDIVTTVTYETHVPKPVVLLDIPKKLILDSIQTPYVFYATMTNVGLITAKDATFEMNGEHNGYMFTPLIEGPWQILPKQSIVIPVEITKIGDVAQVSPNLTRVKKRGSAFECGKQALGNFFHDCGASAGGLSSNHIKASMQTSDACNYGGGGGGGGTIDNPTGSPSGGGDLPPVEYGSSGYTSSGGETGYVSCDADLKCCGPDYANELTGISGGKDAAKAIPGLLPPCSKVHCMQHVRSAKKRIVLRNSSEAVDVDWEALDSLDLSEQMKVYRSMTEFLNEVYADDRVAKPVTSDMVEEIKHNLSLPDGQPSYLKAAYIAMAPAIDYSYHSKLYVHHVLGSWDLPTCEYEEIKKLVETIRMNVNLSDDEMQGMKPAALTDEQYEALLVRLEGDVLDYNFLDECAQRMSKDVMAAQRKGYASLDEMTKTEADKALEQLQSGVNSVCATVKLEISQRMTMTREAVRGILTVENGSTSAAMRNIRLNFVVTDPDGNVATSRIMEIHTESKTGFTGADDYESGWDLAAGAKGVANFLFIPTKYAAPTVPLQYTFAGTITFIDPFTGLEMTRELETERLTVNPSPNLELVYFMQRDILGDDPLTEEVEPMVPSQFSLLINNHGYGDATKVKMVTQQPKIVENEKGLLVDFEILSSQLNGGEKTLAMGTAVATDFGTIPAQSHVYAQWWMTSTLTGHFTSYDVKANHVTSFDNPDLSLLDSVHIHELIHQVEIPGANTTPPLIGFMANDTEDTYDYPDKLYMSDGTIHDIYEAERASLRMISQTEYVLTVGSSAAGWNYSNIADPTGGRRKLQSVVRKSDSANIPLANFWLTDRTLVDKGEPIYENLLHFADSMSIHGETYTLTFEERPALELKVKEYSGINQETTFIREKIDTVTVAFNKPIDEATFTIDDLSLMFEGEYQDLSTVEIVRVNDQTYKIAIGQLTDLDGLYSLTVQTTTINDSEGFYGTASKMASWIQVSDGMANLTMEVSPEGAGIVTPGNSKQPFDGDVALTATPNEGYKFLQWVCEEEILSEEPNYTFHMYGKKTVKAVFSPILYNVTINCDEERGSVTGGSTGPYGYNEVLTLKATANSGYFFAGWKKDDVIISYDEEIIVTIASEVTYTAFFEPLELVTVTLDENASDNTSIFENTYGKRYEITLNRKLSAWQWNTFCVPFDISEQQINKTWGYATSIVELTDVKNGTLIFDGVYNIKAGVPYLIKPERTVTAPSFTFNNDINVSLTPREEQISMDGYDYVGIYSPHAWSNIRSEYYYGVKAGNIIKAKPTTAPLKGMRGYFLVPEGMPVNIRIFEDITDMGDSIDEQPIEDIRIYNMLGIYLGNDVERLAPGIYIINGEKTIIR